MSAPERPPTAAAPAGLLAHPWRWVIGLILLALLVRIPPAIAPGYDPDVRHYMDWSWKATMRGVGSVYRNDNNIAPADNLPGIIYAVWPVGEFYRAFVDPAFPSPAVAPSYLFNIIMCIPAVVADILTALLIYLSVRRRASARRALILLAAYLFNPAVIFDGAFYGQMQSVHTLFIVAALVAIEWRMPTAGWVAIAIAAITKPQTWPFLPIMMVLTFRRHGTKALVVGLAAGVGVVALAALPFYLSGNWTSFAAQQFGLAHGTQEVTVNAHNLWWMVAPTRKVSDEDLLTLVHGLSLTYRLAGILIFGVIESAALLALWRRPRMNWAYALSMFVFLSFFVFVTQMHENYLFSVLALTALALATAPAWMWLSLVVLTTTVLANMTLHFPVIVSLLKENFDAGQLKAARMLNARINVAMWVTMAGLLIQCFRRKQLTNPLAEAARRVRYVTSRGTTALIQARGRKHQPAAGIVQRRGQIDPVRAAAVSSHRDASGPVRREEMASMNDSQIGRGRLIGRGRMAMILPVLAAMVVGCAASESPVTPGLSSTPTMPPSAAMQHEAGATSEPASSGTVPISIAIASSDLAVGRQRFAFSILDKDGALVPDAKTAIQFFRLKGDVADLYATATAQFFPAALEQAGLYVTYGEFPDAGPWGAQISAVLADGSEAIPQRVRFDVAAKARGVAVGEAPPPTANRTLATVPDIGKLTSDPKPEPALYQMTVAEAAASGRPTVVAFSTPAYCQSRICGPVIEEVKLAQKKWGDRVNFIHIEVYNYSDKSGGFDTSQVGPEMLAWRLETEPWVYVLDANGKVAERLEGSVTLKELDPILGRVTGGQAGS